MGSPPAASMTSWALSGWIRGSPNPRSPGSVPVWTARSRRFAPARSITPRFRYVFADATFCKVRVGAHVVSQALVVATGVSAEGTREVLGTAVGDSESFEFWREFLASLKARGLVGVHLVISDAHAGLKAAVTQQFSGSSWQRCRVHFMRNLHGAVSAKHAPAVTAAVKTVFAHTDPEEVAAQWDTVADSLAGSFPKVATMMNDAKADVLAFTAFPRAHCQKIWSNNPIERLNKEIKRRADVGRVRDATVRNVVFVPSAG